MASKTTKVDLVVNALGNGFDTLQRQFQKLRESAESAAEGAAKSGLKWTEFNSKIQATKEVVGQVAQVAAQAYAAISEGAALERASGKFDKLAASIGATSDSIVNGLANATNGMFSNAELMSSASDIISLGLADNEEDVIRLGRVVGELGLDMQQVILTFANDSTMRLDALGLSVEAVTEKTEVYKAAGIAATEAFDMAVLDALEERLELVGTAAGSTAGDLQILEASWKNLTDEVKMAGAEFLAPAIKGYADLATAHRIGQEAVAAGVMTQREYNQLMARTTAAAEQHSEDFIEVADAIGIMEAKLREAADTTEDYGESSRRAANDAAGVSVVAERIAAEGDAYFEATEAAMTYSEKVAAYEAQRTAGAEEAARQAELNSQRMIEAAEAEAEAYRQLVAEQAGVFKSYLEGSEALNLFAGEVDEAGNFIGEATVEQDALNREIYNSVAAAGASMEQLALLGGALDLYSEEAVRAALQTALIQTKINELSAEFVAGTLSFNDMQTEIDKFIKQTTDAANETDNLTDSMNRIPTNISATVEIDTGRASGALDNLIGKVDSFWSKWSGASSAASGSKSASSASAAANAPASPAIPNFSTGGSFVVGSNMPNDSGLFRAQSGERVTVETPQQIRNGIHGNVSINVMGGNAVGTAREIESILMGRVMGSSRSGAYNRG